MKLTMDEKIKEYQSWVLEHGKTPSKNANIKFSDGSDMRSWAHNWRRYVRDFIKEHPKEPLPENLQKIYIMCESIESSFEGKLKLSNKRPDMEVRIQEYMEETRKLGRRPIQKDSLTFKDGIGMVGWYNANNQIYGKNYSIEEILKLNEESLHPFVRMKRELCKEGYYKDQLWKISHLDFEQRTKEYLEWIKIHKHKPSKEVRFSDGVQMDAWYHHQNLVLRSERQQKTVLSSNRMKEIISFAWMENEILKVKDIRSIRKSRMTTEEKKQYFIEYVDKENFQLFPDSFQFPDGTSVKSWFCRHKEELKDYLNQSLSLSLEAHVLEYLEMIKMEGHKLNTRDSRRFSDHLLAATWLQNKEQKVKKERKHESVISNLRMSELYVLALLDDYIYTLEHTSPQNLPVDTTHWVKRIKSSN